MLAVVLIIGLVSALVLPRLGVTASRALDDRAAQLAADLEFARQRTVMTAVPHRVTLDLDRGTWRIEWAPPPTEEEEAEAAAAGRDARDTGLRGRAYVDLSPPPRERGEFEVLPSSFARRAELGSEVFFGAVETPTGPVLEGQVSVAFARDGTAEPARIRLEESGGFAVVLEVRPLADAVVVQHAG